VDLKVHHEIIGARIDRTYAGRELVLIADVQPTCDYALLTIRLGERSGIPKHTIHGIKNIPVSMTLTV
jgi:hypothetical protein